MQKANWLMCASAADEWLIAYSIPPFLRSVKLFAIGHALELYLKATNIKATGTTRYGHSIASLWHDCKQRDSAFMPQYEIRQSVLAADLFSGRDLVHELSNADYLHLAANNALYIVAKLLPDLKYSGLPMRWHTGPFAMGWIFPDDYWIALLRALRAYLQYPTGQAPDIIAKCMAQGGVPASAAAYLKGLY